MGTKNGGIKEECNNSKCIVSNLFSLFLGVFWVFENFSLAVFNVSERVNLWEAIFLQNASHYKFYMFSFSPPPEG